MQIGRFESFFLISASIPLAKSSRLRLQKSGATPRRHIAGNRRSHGFPNRF